MNKPHVFGRISSGATPFERVAAGAGSAADWELVEQQNRQHQQWLKSKAGKRWLKSQRRELKA
jgi:hypothetical protein